MQLKTVCIKNFRRLKDTKIDINPKSTIFVGANNSGKTSATHVFQAFLGGKNDFTLFDFSAECWEQIDKIAASKNITEDIKSLPSISLDLWFDVTEEDLNYILDLLPGLDWTGKPIGIRLEYAVKNSDVLLQNYQKVLTEAQGKKKDEYHPWPKSLSDYLIKRLKNEYAINYYVLDFNQYDDNLIAIKGYSPIKIVEDSERTGAKIIKSLIKVDFLNAQRFLADTTSTGRSEDLSKRLNRFYERNLEKKSDDIDTMKALFDSEIQLTSHLAKVFEPTLDSLNDLGYPGFANPQLVIKAAFNYETVSQNAQLHYSIGKLELPDKYNGLGFKNLIYMVIEILDFHERWIEDKDNQAPLHLILIEEPEAHLHAQLQQVFIKQIWDIINKAKGSNGKCNQLIITTHSPHIIYESGFLPIRYFHRCSDKDKFPTSEVLNLSTFYNCNIEKDENARQSREFLEKYMKLTHCDLFFADAAILVEGNVERLLMPLMIEKAAKSLQSNYLSIIEVGGAFAFRFKELIEFLGLTTLVITDLDSVSTQPENKTEEELEEEENLEGAASKKACMVDENDSITSNQTLVNWLPKYSKISEIIACVENKRTQQKSKECLATVQICYQSRIMVKWEKEELNIIGRTLEEAFALENLEWCQKEENKPLGLRVILKTRNLSLLEIHEKIFKRVKSSEFNKTDFALGLLMSKPEEWKVPAYIEEGLLWLSKQISNNSALSLALKINNPDVSYPIASEPKIERVAIKSVSVQVKKDR